MCCKMHFLFTVFLITLHDIKHKAALMLITFTNASKEKNEHLNCYSAAQHRDNWMFQRFCDAQIEFIMMSFFSAHRLILD